MKYKSLFQLLKKLKNPALVAQMLSEKIKAEAAAQFRSQVQKLGLMEQSEYDFFYATVVAQVGKVAQKDLFVNLPMVEQWMRDDLSQAKDFWEAVLRSIDAKSRTVTNTVLAGIQRRAAREKAGGNTRFALYIGPERDKVIRPYCAALVGKVVELDKLPPNGHGLPPTDFAGGWNCRHSLVPVPADFDGAPRATAEDYAKAAAGARL